MMPVRQAKRSLIFEHGETVHLEDNLDDHVGNENNSSTFEEDTTYGINANNDVQNSTGDKDKDCVHNGISSDIIPSLGLEFESEQLAFEFYNNYAKRVGFSIRRNNVHFSKTGIILDRVFSCSSQGKRKNDKRDDEVKSHRAETRFDCPAELRVSSRPDGIYRVYKFEPNHSHQLLTPSKIHFLRSHRTVTKAQKLEIDMAESCGIAPKASLDLLAAKVGGRENVGFIPDDYRNYLRTKRMTEMRVGDTGGLLEYLQKMQAEDPSFSYAIQVDIDDLVTNIFWADGRMKLDYGHFGDVVCFDTTYRKNKEGRPFAMFVGVNHHKQTTIFGAALLYDETCETFEWLFSTYSRIMSGKTPKTILTDQDAAMAKALRISWPETTHRLCVWHIYQNAARHLASVFDKFKDFAKDFSSCVYDHDDVPDFLEAWGSMLEKYNLKDNEWLKGIFEVKEKWALVYGRQTFCAQMSTTQRSESMNNQIKKYISYKHDLLRFFHHFQRLVKDRRYEESKADTKASQTFPALTLKVEILTHAASVYTPAIFKLFNQEVWKTWNYEVEQYEQVGSIKKYKVAFHGKARHHVVTYDSSNCTVSCGCKKFEFAGILCAHSLRVFSLNNVRRVPDMYILKRWTKSAKAGIREAPNMHIIDENPKEAMGRRYKELSRLFNSLVARASETEKAYEIAMSGHNRLIQEVEDCFKSLAFEGQPSTDIDTESNVVAGENIENASAAKGKGTAVKGIKLKEKKGVAGGSKRMVSALDKATRKKRVSKGKLIPDEATSNIPNANLFAQSQCNQWNSNHTGSYLPLHPNMAQPLYLTSNNLSNQSASHEITSRAYNMTSFSHYPLAAMNQEVSYNPNIDQRDSQVPGRTLNHHFSPTFGIPNMNQAFVEDATQPGW